MFLEQEGWFALFACTWQLWAASWLMERRPWEGAELRFFLLEAQQKAGTLCEKGLMRLAGASGGGPVWCWCCPGLSGSLGELLCDGCPIGSSHLGPFHKNSNYCSPNGKDLYPLGRVHSTLSYVKP